MHRMTLSTAVSVAALLALLSMTPASWAKDDDAIEAALDTFRKAMDDRDERARIRAIEAIAVLDHKDIDRELRECAFRDRSSKVKAAAFRALGRRGDSKNLAAYVQALKALKKEPEALVGVLDALGYLGDPRVAEEVYDAARSWLKKDREVTIAAIRALGNIRSKESVEYLILTWDLTIVGGGQGAQVSQSVQEMLASYRPYVVDSLQRVTGEIIQMDFDIWKEWWEEHERTFKPPEGPADPNRQIAFLDTEYRYGLLRATADWKWLEVPAPGYDRTMSMVRDGVTVSSFSVLAYSVLRRDPMDAEAMAKEMEERLRKEYSTIREEKWNEKVQLGGQEAIRHTVNGVRGAGPALTSVTVLRHGDVMYVIEGVLYPGSGPFERDSITEMLKSFRLLE